MVLFRASRVHLTARSFRQTRRHDGTLCTRSRIKCVSPFRLRYAADDFSRVRPSSVCSSLATSQMPLAIPSSLLSTFTRAARMPASTYDRSETPVPLLCPGSLARAVFSTRQLLFPVHEPSRHGGYEPSTFSACLIPMLDACLYHYPVTF